MNRVHRLPVQRAFLGLSAGGGEIREAKVQGAAPQPVKRVWPCATGGGLKGRKTVGHFIKKHLGHFEEILLSDLLPKLLQPFQINHRELRFHCSLTGILGQSP